MNNKKIQTVLIIVGIVFLVSLTLLVSVIISNKVEEAKFIGLDSQHLRTIRVTGEGKVQAVPDMARVSFSILTSHEDQVEALNENNKKADQVITYLKEQGVEEKNIQTIGFNVQPIYDRHPETFVRDKIIRYEVSNRVEVELKDLEKANTIIDGAIRSGANRVNNFQFLIEDETELRKQAREKAVKEAEEKAQEIASVLKVKIGRIIDFSESRDYYVMPMRGMAMDMVAEASVPDLPLEPGENEITVRVTIDYEIK